jgi:hypothetical protein
MSMKVLRRGGTCYLIRPLLEIARGLVWAGVRIKCGIDRGFGGNGALCRLELASQYIVPDGQLWPTKDFKSLPSLENLEIGHPSAAIRRIPYQVSRASSS